MLVRVWNNWNYDTLLTGSVKWFIYFEFLKMLYTYPTTQEFHSYLLKRNKNICPQKGYVAVSFIIVRNWKPKC